ncbi:MAG: hypothetical protein IBJ07_00705 [Rhizobiaceae bacterium]|jgi:hypothetical protein|nr:hypothetical protein [Rhizobiaceae bacterium]
MEMDANTEALMLQQQATDKFLNSWYSAVSTLSATPRTNGRGVLVDETGLSGRLREAEIAIDQARKAIALLRAAPRHHLDDEEDDEF